MSAIENAYSGSLAAFFAAMVLCPTGGLLHSNTYPFNKFFPATELVSAAYRQCVSCTPNPAGVVVLIQNFYL